MLSEELKLILQEGEGLTIEFKERYTSKIDKDLVAFANSKGGRLFIGVDDQGKIVGEKLTNKLKAEINALARNCDPLIHIKNIKQVENVIILEIEEGDEKPYSSSSGYYRRLDAVTQKMTHKEVRMFFRENESVPFETLPCANLDFKDISIAKIRSLLKETGTKYKINRNNLPLLFSSLGIIHKDKINNAGALMFAAKIEKYIPHSESILAAFKGMDKTHIFDRKNVCDDLLTQFNEAINFLTKHLNIRSEIHGVNRYDIYEIPLDALREAVVNAIIHRDYTMKGTSIYIMIFDDRVEIENPGCLPHGVTKQSLGKSSVRRNPIIADLFHRMGKVERMGSGIGRMRHLMRKAGLKEPKFEMDHFFRVIFYRDSKYALKNTTKTVVKTVGKTVVKILDLIKNNPKITQTELTSKTGLSRRGIEWNLNKLKKEGFLRRIGSARAGYWSILKNNLSKEEGKSP